MNSYNRSLVTVASNTSMAMSNAERSGWANVARDLTREPPVTPRRPHDTKRNRPVRNSFTLWPVS